ncbi:MAG: iron chelate uptake ABC transporter family permease subunit [Microbacteriaceae bacterium]|nr:iron chelate uptake ABC transporter family permease subunit [Microbacteriaceae bacterium]
MSAIDRAVPVRPAPAPARSLARGRAARGRRRILVTAGLGLLVLVLAVVSLMVGRTFYGLDVVIPVVFGAEVDGATFTVGTLRLPRMVLGLFAGFAFGLAGVTFQTMLRNALASPDVIGITSGAGAAATFAIMVLHLSEQLTALFAITGALVVAVGIYLLSRRGGAVGTRLILIGIGVAAMLDAVIAYVTVHTGSFWDQAALMRWFTGSLNGATWSLGLPLIVGVAVLAPLLLALGRDLGLLRLGDDAASALGVRVGRTRLLAILAAVGLIAVATAATGPIAFVAFLAGPIASHLVKPGGSLLLPAAFVGAALVLAADLVGQWLLPSKLPVGVITGIIGAPYLLLLLISTNRKGATL